MSEIIGVFQPKGGVGKTTLALQLAGACHRAGQKVGVVDLDQQQSSMDVYSIGNLPFPVVVEKDAYKLAGFDVVVGDYPAGLKGRELLGEVMETTSIICPCKPAFLDFKALMRELHGHADGVHLAINQMDMRCAIDRKFAKDVRDYFRSVSEIRMRSAYRRVMSEGITIFDEKAVYALKARAEIEMLLQRVRSF